MAGTGGSGPFSPGAAGVSPGENVELVWETVAVVWLVVVLVLIDFNFKPTEAFTTLQNERMVNDLAKRFKASY